MLHDNKYVSINTKKPKPKVDMKMERKEKSRALKIKIWKMINGNDLQTYSSNQPVQL